MHTNQISSVVLLSLFFACFLAITAWSGPSRAADPPGFDAKLLDALVARPLGPANMGGRLTSVAVVESNPSTMYIGAASGGLWKTVNNGTTWTPLFDQQGTSSIGAVAVAPSNPQIVWVGTGEANPRNSVSWGDGVYKSVDGGQHWQRMGLTDSAHIGRIVIHPLHPDIVYVAALGRLWGPSKERGLFKTSDGGQTWKAVHFIDESTGCIDLVMDPDDADLLYAAAYQVRRDAFAGSNPAQQTGPGSGLFKTSDGGRTWKRLTQGLPARPLGRCGLGVCRKDPWVVYAVIQTDKTITQTSADQEGKPNHQVDNGGIFRSDDRGETWRKLNDLCPRPFYYGQVRVDPRDPQRLYVLGVALHLSTDGGKTFQDTGAKHVHADHHDLWIDPRRSDHLVLAGDGGLYFSYDQGANWEHLNHLPVGQFYEISLDQRKPYRIYGGLQDNGSWGGPSSTRHSDGIVNADWFRVMGADGFFCQVDPSNPDRVYAEGQWGQLRRCNVRNGRGAGIRPQPARGQPDYRFNWNSPLLLSVHDANTLYFGGNYLFRSSNRGDHWDMISPDLTRGKPGPSPDSGHTITTIAESPLRPGLLFVGTDDGRLHVSGNGGGNWTDLSDRVPGMPAERWIRRIECSHFAEGTVYLAIDRHRSNDRAPYLFKSLDYGATWQPLAGNLPASGPVHVIREDPRNQELLFVGTEHALFASLDGGHHWYPLRRGLPTVPIHDLAIHPRDRDLVIATHGRSLYVLDIAPLEELTPRVLAEDVHLFDVKSATAYQLRGTRGATGARVFAAPNPPYGAALYYYLNHTMAEVPRLTIFNVQGRAVAELDGEREAGLHHVTWNLGQTVGILPARIGPVVDPGDYAVQLQVGNRIWRKKLRVEDEE